MFYEEFIKKKKNQKTSRLKKKNILLNLFYEMKRLRLCEEEIEKEYHPADEMRCPVHLCVGQESAPAALSQVIKKKDYLFSHHRTHGYFLSKGSKMKELFAELYGKETGSSGGLSGSMDISSPKDKFFSGAILAGAASIAMGVAMNLKMSKTKDTVVFAGLGDGATEEGIFWETLNYAGLHKLPIIFICENNNYSTFSPQKKRQSGSSIATRAKSFGVKSDQISGSDVSGIYKMLNKITKNVRKGSGPYLIEIFTYRFSSHVGTNDEEKKIIYRNKKEIDFWKKFDPIGLLEKSLIKDKIINYSKIKKIDDKIKKEIIRSFLFAKKSKFLKKINWDNLNYDRSSILKKNKIIKLHQSNFDFNQKNKQNKGF